MERPILANFSKGNFAAMSWFPHSTQMCVMPLVAHKGRQVRCLGTCFAVHNQGLVLTARHVIDEAFNLGWSPDSGGPKQADVDRHGWSVGALYAANAMPERSEHELLGGLLPLRRAYMHADLDIAVLALNLPVHVDTGLPLRMPVFKLSPGLPALNSLCFGLGYHAMKSESGEDCVQIAQSYSASKGSIVETYVPASEGRASQLPMLSD